MTEYIIQNGADCRIAVEPSGFGKQKMMKINAKWHLANKMPKNPTLDQRVMWYLEHARNCTCRTLGGKILEEIKKRGLKV